MPDRGANDLADTVRDERDGPTVTDLRSFARSCQTNPSPQERTNVFAVSPDSRSVPAADRGPATEANWLAVRFIGCLEPSTDTVICSNMASHYSFATEAPLGRGNAS